MQAVSQSKRITEYIKNTFDVEPEFLWEATPDACVFRQPNSRKWFGIMMTVSRDKLGLPGSGSAAVINAKCDPILVGSLLNEKGFLPAYHMNKTLWISILLNETVTDGAIFPLIEMSYESVTPKGKKKAIKADF